MDQTLGEKRVKYVTVSSDEAGGRLDNFLVKHLKNVPKSRIYRAIRSGEVRVDKSRAQASTRLAGGEVIRIPPISSTIPKVPTYVSPGIQSLLTQAILFEDTQVIVLNKPAGLPVHGGTDTSIGIIEAMRLITPHGQHLELVHRLDKNTSGCLMIAKKRSTLRALHQAIRESQIQKTYQLLVAGHWPKHIQKVTLPLRKFQLQSGERMVIVDPQAGKPCETRFKPITYFSDATWMEATLITGRTHQIRVHCAQTGYPIIGDEKYGKKNINAEYKNKGLNRMALHAARLIVHCPEIALDFTVEAPLPESLSAIINNL